MCRDCNGDFVFTAGEQDFFSTKGFTPPNRCKACRDKRKAEKEQGSVNQGPAPRAVTPEPIREYRNRSRVVAVVEPEIVRENTRRDKQKNRRYRDMDEDGVDW